MREGEKMKAEADDGGRNNEGGETGRENRDGDDRGQLFRNPSLQRWRKIKADDYEC